MFNAAKLKKKATELEQKKQFEKALQIYVQILDEAGRDLDDADIPLYNRVGDLLTRQGNTTEALAYYEKAVDVYAERGFLNNAIALCNKILRQSPARTAVYYKLGKISATKGFKSDAKKNFLEYADRMQKVGQLDEAFRALKEFADLCPDQDDFRLMLADQLSRENRKDEALEQLHALYTKLDAEGRTVEARATMARMKAIDPETEPKASGSYIAQRTNDLVFLDLDVSAARAQPIVDEEPPVEEKRPTPKSSTSHGIPSLEGLALTFLPDEDDALADAAPSITPLDGFEATATGEMDALPEPPALEIEYVDDDAVVDAIDAADAPTTDGLVAIEGFSGADAPDVEALDGFERTSLTEEPPPHAPLIDDPLMSGREFAALELTPGDQPRERPEHDLALPATLPRLDTPESIEIEAVVASGHESVEAAASTVDLVDMESPEFVPLIDQIELDEPEARGLEAAGLLDLGAAETSPKGEDTIEPMAVEALGVVPEPMEAELDAPSPTESPVLEVESPDASADVRIDETPTQESVNDDATDFLRNPPSFGEGSDDAAPSFEPDPLLLDTPAEWSEEEAPEVLIDGEWHDEHVGDTVRVDEALPAPASKGGRFDDLAAAMMWTPEQSSESDAADSSPAAAAPHAEGPSRAFANSDPDLIVLHTPRSTLSLGGVEAQLRRRLEMDPANWSLRRQLGEALLDAGDRDLGLQELDVAMTGLEIEGDIAGAHDIADGIIRTAPSSVRHHQKRVEYAVRTQQRGRLIEAYLELADALFRAGQPDKASVVYSRVIELSPNSERARMALSALGDTAVEGEQQPLVDAHDEHAAAFLSTSQLAEAEAASGGHRSLEEDVDAAATFAESIQEREEQASHDASAPDEVESTTPESELEVVDAVGSDDLPVAAATEVEADDASPPVEENADVEPIAVDDAADDLAVEPASVAEIEDSPPTIDTAPNEVPVEVESAAVDDRSDEADRARETPVFTEASEIRGRTSTGAPAIPTPVEAPIATATPSAATPVNGTTSVDDPRLTNDADFVDLGEWLRMGEPVKSTRMVISEAIPTGDEQADFEDMLRRFKQGVAENVEEEDFDSHYDLGVAFKEMGLVDEAIAEFQKALRGQSHRERAYEALGQCFVEKGQLQVAITLLTRAVETSGADDQHLVGVLYLLGYAMESMGRGQDALSYYQRVFAVDIEFRDVANRVSALERVTT